MKLDKVFTILREVGNLPGDTDRAVKDNENTGDRIMKGSGDNLSPNPDLGAEGEKVSGNAEGKILNGRFEVVKWIGAGGLSIVYKALDRLKLKSDDPNPFIAVKVLKGQFHAHPGRIAALEQEAIRSRRLVHPNIVRVYDFHRDGKTVYVAMEYLQGAPLTQYIRSKNSQRLPTERALQITNDIGKALSFAHENGIIHCDVKPGNVFLTDTGEAKLIDFGLARVFRYTDNEDTEDNTDDNMPSMASPAYASPDILEKHDPEPSDDVYSLACTAYELLTGAHPFDYQTAIEARGANSTVKQLKGLNRRQWQTLKQALIFDRDQRTSTIKEFLTGLLSWGWRRTATRS